MYIVSIAFFRVRGVDLFDTQIKCESQEKEMQLLQTTNRQQAQALKEMMDEDEDDVGTPVIGYIQTRKLVVPPKAPTSKTPTKASKEAAAVAGTSSDYMTQLLAQSGITEEHQKIMLSASQESTKEAQVRISNLQQQLDGRRNSLGGNSNEEKSIPDAVVDSEVTRIAI